MWRSVRLNAYLTLLAADAVIQKTAMRTSLPRLVAIPGIGPVTATALIAAIGKRGPSTRRDLQLDGCTREHSTGASRAARISKRATLTAKTVRARRNVPSCYSARSSLRSDAVLAQLTSRTHRTSLPRLATNSPNAWAVLAK